MFMKSTNIEKWEFALSGLFNSNIKINYNCLIYRQQDNDQIYIPFQTVTTKIMQNLKTTMIEFPMKSSLSRFCYNYFNY